MDKNMYAVNKILISLWFIVSSLIFTQTVHAEVYSFEQYKDGDMPKGFVWGDRPWEVTTDQSMPAGQQKALHVPGDYSKNNVALVDRKLPAVYSLEVKMRIETPERWEGIVFDYIDNNKFYCMRINIRETPQSTISLLKMTAAGWVDLQDVMQYGELSTQKYHVLKITRNRSTGTIIGYVNGQAVVSAVDNDYTSGRVGVKEDSNDHGWFREVGILDESSAKEQQSNSTSSRRPAILFVSTEYPNTNPMKLDDRVKKELQAQGYEIGWTRNWGNLTLNFLRQFNAVICYTFPRSDSTIGASEQVQKQMDVLRQYVNEGGGVFITGQAEQEPGHYGLITQNIFLKPLGGQILYEQVNDEENRHFCANSSLEFCWTDRIFKDALTEGVSGLWYPGRGLCAGSVWTSPVVVDKNWKILAKGMPSARSWLTNFDNAAFNQEGATYTESPPLLAVRQYGKGCIVLWPLENAFTFVDGYHPYVLEGGIVMDSDINGKKSQGDRLIHNLLQWLIEPSFTAGTMGGYVHIALPAPVELGFSRVDWASVPPMEIPFKNAYLGLVGAQSNLSCGEDSPEMLIETAKKAGYQFIVFTEDLAKLTRENWDKLSDVCRKNTDEHFRALPGLYFVDSFDSAFVVFGNIGYPSDSWRDPNDPQKRIRWANGFARGYAVCPPIALVKTHSNGRPPRMQANHHGFAIYAYEGDRLVDENLKDYLICQREGLVLFPLAVHLVRNGKEILNARHTGFQTYIRANSLDKIIESIDDMGGSRGKYYKPSFVSSGPEIMQLYAENWGTADLAIPDNDRHRVQVAVRSDAELTEVEIFDNGEVIRRFLPKSKEFRVEFDNFHDCQHDYVVRAKDEKGGVAISWDRETQVQECWAEMCSDNWNDLERGKWFEEKIQPLRAVEEYLPPPVDVLQRWPMVTGHEPGKSPENYGNISAMKESALVSRYGWILDYSLDTTYPPGKGGRDENIYEFPLVPNSNITGRLRDIFFCRRAGEVSLHLIEGRMTARRDVETDKEFPIRFFNSNNRTAAGRLNHFAWIDENGKSVTEVPAGVSVWNKEVSMNSGDYAAIFPDLCAVFALDKGCASHMKLTPQGTFLYLGPAEQPEFIKKGTEFRYQYVYMTGSLGVPGNQEAEDIRLNMGLAGTPAYSVTPSIGSVDSTRLVLELKAEGSGWRGKITQAHLPLNLPVIIHGLNKRWSAGVWYKGTNRLLVPEWPQFDEFGYGSWVEKKFQQWRERADEIQRFAILGDTGYLQLDTEGGDRDVFIGNLLTCDNPNVWLTFIREPKRNYCVAHNPMDRLVRCRIRPGKGFNLLGNFEKRVVIPQGSSVTVNLP